MFTSLPFFMAVQLIVSSIFLLTIVWYHDNSLQFDKYERLAAIEKFVVLGQESWFWPVFLLCMLGILVSMYYLLKITTVHSSKPLLVTDVYYWIVFVLYIVFVFGWIIFFCTIASDAICDPIVRFISPNNDEAHETFSAIPLSEVPNSDITFLMPRETNPKVNGICIAKTEYSVRGQQQVTVAVVACLIAYVVCVVSKLAVVPELTLPLLFLENMLVLITFSLGMQIIFNDQVWDWRVFVSIFFSFLVSVFSTVSVLFRDDQSRKSSWIFCMIWIYAQVLDSIERAFYSIFESKTNVSVYF